MILKRVGKPIGVLRKHVKTHIFLKNQWSVLFLKGTSQSLRGGENVKSMGRVRVMAGERPC